MKAVLLEGYGGVDQLVYKEVPIPVAGPGEVLVKLIATSVNPIDLKIRRGAMKAIMPLQLPAILGYDLSGEVVALGEGATGVAVNDRVMAVTGQCYAEYVPCKAEFLAHIPPGLDPVDAGGLPLVLTTGAQLIELGVQPLAGQRVLITGALGGVGRTAVHVARQHGAFVIAGVRGSERVKAEKLSPDAIVAVDEEKEVAALQELDAVADTVGGATIDRLLPRIRKNGVLATVVGKPASAEGQEIQVREVWSTPDAKRLEQLAQDLVKGEFSIRISRGITLAQMGAAHELAEKGGVGKLVVTP